jgi:coiled-coil domain-containing protein 130
VQAIGNYHSTKIWSFRMTTPCCQNKIEIHTDPKNARYIIVEGAKQKASLMKSWCAGFCLATAGVCANLP